MNTNDELRSIADELDKLVVHVAKAAAEYPAECLDVATSGTLYLRINLGFGVRYDLWLDLYGIQLKETAGAVKALKGYVRGSLIAREMSASPESFQVVLFKADSLVNINSKLVKQGWATKAVP